VSYDDLLLCGEVGSDPITGGRTQHVGRNERPERILAPGQPHGQVADSAAASVRSMPTGCEVTGTEKSPGISPPGSWYLRLTSRRSPYIVVTTMIWFAVSVPVLIVNPPANNAGLKPLAAGGVARNT